MPTRKAHLTDFGKSFGERLAKLRKAAGYSTRTFGAEVGISNRMVFYYENECERVPVYLLPVFARILGVSTDQLLGVEEIKDKGKHRNSRLWKRFNEVEKLPPGQYRQIVQIIDAFLERAKLKKES